MKPSLVNNLQQLVGRFEELGGLLSDPDVIGNQQQFRELSQEYARLEPVVELFARYEQAVANTAAAEEMLNDSDAELRELGREEAATAQAETEQLETELRKQLVPKDPRDEKNVIIEIRAAEGGADAKQLVDQQLAVYTKFAARRRL